MITPNRDRVIHNIEANVNKKAFNDKVEVDDPNLSDEEKWKILRDFITQREAFPYKVKNRINRMMVNSATWYFNRETEITGIEKVKNIKSSAIITSNHFNPVDNTIIRTLAKKLKKQKLYVISQETNLAMPGIIGFLMKYADIIPISGERKYMGNIFPKLIQERIDNNDLVLIYPEQEMWFNYRKPRPLKRGAYYYAARYGVPIISCFVEIRDLEEMETEEFHKVKYILHILDPIFPDSTKSIKEDSKRMCEIDYMQKTEAYEKVYGKKLDYAFKNDDIAGWVPVYEKERRRGK